MTMKMLYREAKKLFYQKPQKWRWNVKNNVSLPGIYLVITF